VRLASGSVRSSLLAIVVVQPRVETSTHDHLGWIHGAKPVIRGWITTGTATARSRKLNHMDDTLRATTASYADLHEGYGNPNVAGTVGFVRGGDVVLVTDPGTVRDRASILDPLDSLGVAPEDVTDVGFSHPHPDHLPGRSVGVAGCRRL
jgi:hypothetical protein